MEKHCEDEKCKNYWACKYLKDRFGVKKCSTYHHIKILIEVKYQKELKARKELLKGLSE